MKIQKKIEPQIDSKEAPLLRRNSWKAMWSWDFSRWLSFNFTRSRLPKIARAAIPVLQCYIRCGFSVSFFRQMVSQWLLQRWHGNHSYLTVMLTRAAISKTLLPAWPAANNPIPLSGSWAFVRAIIGYIPTKRNSRHNWQFAMAIPMARWLEILRVSSSSRSLLAIDLSLLFANISKN